MKKIKIIIVIIISIFIVTACNSNNKIKSNGTTVDTSKMTHKHCTRSASASSGVEAELYYDIYYTGDTMNIIESTETVTTSDKDTLKQYQSAYEGINEHYKDLKYYDSTVTVNDDSVTRHTVINYDKIDINKLLKIEGEEDNIIENGQAKVQLWLDLAKKVGTKCEEVSE